MDDPTQPVDSSDLVGVIESLGWLEGDWHFELDPSMRPCGVVVLDELRKDALKVAFVSDEEPVQALGPDAPDETLGEGIGTWCPDRCLDDPSANRSHHFVEGSDELGVAILDQELHHTILVIERYDEVSRLLGDPASDRVFGDASEEDLASFEVDEEQDVEASQGDGVDGEEVARQRSGCLSSKELDPAGSRASWGWCKAVASKHVSHTGGGNGGAELPQLADDTEVTPARILSSEPEHKTDYLRVERILGATVRGRPVASDELVVPAHERCRCDEEDGPASSRQESCERRQESSVSWEFPVVLPAGARSRAGDEGRRSRCLCRPGSDRFRGASEALEQAGTRSDSPWWP